MCVCLFNKPNFMACEKNRTWTYPEHEDLYT